MQPIYSVSPNTSLFIIKKHDKQQIAKIDLIRFRFNCKSNILCIIYTVNNVYCIISVLESSKHFFYVIT